MKFLVRMQYEKSDYDAFVRLAGKKLSRAQTLLMRLMCIIVGIVAVVFAAVLYQNGEGASQSLSWILLLAAIVFLCLGAFFYSYQAWTLQRKQPKNTGGTVYTFKEKSFHMESGLGEQEYAYERLLGAYETDGHIFLMVGAKSALVLPKRSFVVGTPRGLIEFLEKKLGRPVEKVAL